MQELVANLLKQLKAIKIPASKVEKDLGFSNGQLGQVAKGKSKLSEDRLNKLGQYTFLKTTAGKETGYMKVDETGKTEVGINPPDPDNEKKVKELTKKAKSHDEKPSYPNAFAKPIPEGLSKSETLKWLRENR